MLMPVIFLSSFRGFSDILLRGFRAVAEANGFADGYASFQ